MSNKTTHTKNYDHNFTLMVFGQVISLIGSAVLRFALELYVLDITGRADIFATVMAISMVPTVIFSPIGGAIADRFNRRNLMVIFDFASSALVLLTLLLYLNDWMSIPLVTIAITLLSIISAMYQPAVQASIPVLVTEDGLAQANGIVSGIGAISGIIGPVLGGVLYGFFGLKLLLIISCGAFFCSAVMEIFIKIPFTKQTLTRHIIPTMIGDMKDGLNYMIHKNKRLLRTIALAPALNLFMTSFIIIGAPYVLRITLKSSDTMYGVGMALAQIAGIAGALLIGIFAPKMKLETLYKWLLGIAALMLPMALAVTPLFLKMGYWPTFILFFAGAMLIMMFATIVSIFVITEVQKITPNEMLGKIMSIIMAVSQCAVPLGQLLYGGSLELFADRIYVSVLIAAVCTSLVACVGKVLLRPDSSAA